MGILVTNPILKYALLLKRPPCTNGKELGKNQNKKVVENFKNFLMVQIFPNYDLRANSYSHDKKIFQESFHFLLNSIHYRRGYNVTISSKTI